MTNIRLFRREALKEAYTAGVIAALADPSNMKDAFDAGERRGSGFLNEAVNAPNFFEFMKPRRKESPGSFSSWFGRNEKRLSTIIDKEQYELVATEKSIEIKSGKKMITMDAIEKAIKHVFDTQIDELRFNRRRADFIKIPRFFAWYLSYHHCHNTLADMGLKWGSKHYATVLHGAKCVYRDATLYSDDRRKLVLLYRYLARNNYDITHFVQDDDMPSRSGNNRTIVKRVNM